MFKWLTQRIFWTHLMLALLVLLMFGYFSMEYLKVYTRHGESITVPDLRGMSVEEVSIFTADKNLLYQVVDSTFDLNKPPGSVIEQDPPPMSKVKEDRKIYLTINAFEAPSVKMPDLLDKSLRQAILELESWGLKVGTLSYAPDWAKNAVLEQQLNGSPIMPGDRVKKGSFIDLVLGDGLGNTEQEIPDLIGLSLQEVRFLLRASSLNLGAVVYTGSISDTATAVVYRQQPNPAGSQVIKLGEAIDVFLTQTLPDSLLDRIDQYSTE